jgi:hypothetical protein
MVAAVDLDSLPAKAAEVGPWAASRWPTFGDEFGEVTDGLRDDAASPRYLPRAEALANELEDHLGTGLRAGRHGTRCLTTDFGAFYFGCRYLD